MFSKFLQILSRFRSSDSGYFRLCLDKEGGGGNGNGDDGDDDKKYAKKYAKKFNTPEETAAGYLEVEKKLAETSAEKSELQTANEKLQQEVDGYRKTEADANKKKSAAVLDADADPAVAKAQKALDVIVNEDHDKLSGVDFAKWQVRLNDATADLREAKAAARKAADKETHKKVSGETIDRFIADDRKYLQKKHDLSDDEMKDLGKFGLEHGCQTFSEAYYLSMSDKSSAELKTLKDAAEKGKNKKDKDERRHPKRRSTDPKDGEDEKGDAPVGHRKTRMRVVDSAAKDKDLDKTYKALRKETGQGTDE